MLNQKQFLDFASRRDCRGLVSTQLLAGEFEAVERSTSRSRKRSGPTFPNPGAAAGEKSFEVLPSFGHKGALTIRIYGRCQRPGGALGLILVHSALQKCKKPAEALSCPDSVEIFQ